MLWYKAWLETRWRILLTFAGMFFFLLDSSSPLMTAQPRQRSPISFVGMMVTLVAPLWLAGSGVRTESPMRIMKGLQGSMYFTLSLPVSRRRLLASRVAFGLLALLCIVAVGLTASALIPGIRRQIPADDALRFAVTCFFYGFATFGVSTAFATFLDQQWQAFATIAFVFLGDGLLIHANGHLFVVPWTALAIAGAIGLTGLFAALKIEEFRQY